MNKLLATAAIAGLMAAPALSLPFKNLGNVITPGGIVEVNSSGFAFGGDPFRFLNGLAGSPQAALPAYVPSATELGLAINSAGGAAGLAGSGAGDFFGVFKVNNILAQTSVLPGQTDIWNSGDDSKDIVGVFYGIQDGSFSILGSGTAGDPYIADITANTGGRVEYYLVDDTAWDANLGLGSTGTSFLAGEMTYGSLTSGTKLARFDYTQDSRRINLGDGTPVSLNPFAIGDPFNQGENNDGGYEATLVNGWGDESFEGFFDNVTGPPDVFDGDYTMNLNQNQLIPWQLTYNHDPLLTANPIPEPSTLLLLGTGLLGMVGYARRRKAA